MGNEGNLLVLISNVPNSVNNYIYLFYFFSCFYLAFVSGCFVFPYENSIKVFFPLQKGEKMGFELTGPHYWEHI